MPLRPFSVARLPLRRGALVAAAVVGVIATATASLAGQQLAPAAGGVERPKPTRIARPKPGSLEYRLSWGLASINADRAYARGSNGSGITVALIDTGVSGVPVEVFGRVSEASTDLVASRKHGALKADHGEQTAGLLAAALDGTGTVGVAYGATLLSIRVDIDGSCRTQCAVRGQDLARGIDYALAQGARVIGVPLVGPARLRSVEPALQRAAAAGAVIVAAAGNDGGAAPSWPARYAADPRLARAMIVAGATTPAGRLAPWSSKAGGTGGRFLGAPGENVVVDCDAKYCKLASGTSYSVAYVAGAVSLIMASQPGLPAQEAADLLLRGALDHGAKGADPISGAGVLDVSRALRLARRAEKRKTA